MIGENGNQGEMDGDVSDHLYGWLVKTPTMDTNLGTTDKEANNIY